MRMKALKRDVQSVIKNLKALTEKAEKMAKRLDAVENVKAPKKRVTKSGSAATRKKTVKAKKPVKPAKAAKTVKTAKTATDTILAIIKRQKKGIDTASLKKKTDFDTKTIRNVIFRLKKQGKIQSTTRGIYMAI
jgi:hypothetical protein